MLMSMRSSGVKSARYPLHETAVPQTHACFLTPVATDWVICDTSGYCACPADRGSHAIVPIIPNKACSYVTTYIGTKSGSGDRWPFAK